MFIVCCHLKSIKASSIFISYTKHGAKDNRDAVAEPPEMYGVNWFFGRERVKFIAFKIDDRLLYPINFSPMASTMSLIVKPLGNV